MSNIDYCIIGAGPSGITLGYILGSIGKKCVIIDSNSSIGGCHRVTRVKTPGLTHGMFTEHSPRIYSYSYVNMINILQSMGYSFKDIFTKYNFSISTIGGKTISSLTFREILCFVRQFLKSLFVPCYGKDISMDEFMNKNCFKDSSKDYIDRLCRLTDGAGSDRYNLYEFMSLLNQQASYSLVQPILPNDLGLLALWQKALDKTGNVNVLLDTYAISLNGESTVMSLDISNNKGISKIIAKNYIICIPPNALVKLLDNSNKNIQTAFGPLAELKTWSNNNSYIIDPGMTFHWDSKINLPKIWGMPSSDWGVAFMVLSDYMDFKDPRSLTVMSCCITRVNIVSSFTGKTANQTSNIEELLTEVFRQIKLVYPVLQTPTYKILSPTVSYYNNEWVETDSAYVETYFNKSLKSHGIIPNLFNVGMQNGNSIYAFTSFEGAVTNALFLSHKLEPETKKYQIKNIKTLSSLVRKLIIVLCFTIILIVIVLRYK